MEHNDIVLVEAKDQGQFLSTTNLYLTGMVNDHDILAIGHCGPSLEHVFNQLGRQFKGCPVWFHVERVRLIQKA